MRKKLDLVLLTCCAAVLYTFCAYADATERISAWSYTLHGVESDEDGMKYCSKGGVSVLTQGNLLKKHVEIRKGTAAIGDHAFDGRDGEVRVAMESVVIPEGVLEIGRQAFQSCHSLKKVILPKSLRYLGLMAFRGCTNLTEITIGSTDVEICTGAFLWCPLKKITVPASCREDFYKKGMLADFMAKYGDCQLVFAQEEGEAPKPLQDAEKIVSVGEDCLTVGSLRDYMRLSVVKEWGRTAPPHVSLVEGLINRSETCVDAFITVMALRKEVTKHGWSKEDIKLCKKGSDGLDLYAGLCMEKMKIERFLKEKVACDIAVADIDVDAELAKIEMARKSAEEQGNKAYKRILEIKKRLDAGERFVDVAKECSDCPSSAKGGMLGRFKRGTMVKPFEEVAFSLPVGKVSEPVRTQFGWHLILVSDRSGGTGVAEEIEASHILCRAFSFSSKSKPLPSREAIRRGLEKKAREKVWQTFIGEIRGKAGAVPDEDTRKCLIREVASLVVAEIDAEKAKVSKGSISNVVHIVEAESMQNTETTSIGEIDISGACADADLVKAMSDAVKDALRRPDSMMMRNAFSMATFPSWDKSECGIAYAVGEYVCIWRKKPLLDIEADRSRWVVGLGEGYEARMKGLERSGLKYLHSLALYRKGVFKGDVPVPVIVLTVEKSNHAKNPYVCAFTPEGHKNFKNTDSLSVDKDFLHDTLSAVSAAVNGRPSKIGNANRGLELLRKR